MKPNCLTTLLAILAVLVGLATVAASGGARKPGKRRPRPAFQPVEDVQGLPRVLLLGDSISIGYTVPVRELLGGKANVHRPAANCGPTTRGLQHLDAWLGTGKWDVIHFNWGLHDLKYISPKGGLTAVDKGKQQVPIDQYEANLERLVERLKKTGATLIWASTTPVPEGAKGRVPGDEVKYNAVAKKVMDKHEVATDGLYAFAKPRLDNIQRPANVHFTPDGSKALAAQVAKSILAALQK
ncbi:MAG: SGNH/GDSL hydrolase family protein [Planctomycetota bacterium]